MKTSPNGYMFLKTMEVGPALVPLLIVKADGDKLQIGYGHDLLPGETYPNGITFDYAEQLLTGDVFKVEAYLDAMIPESCTQNQYDALISFGYNAGRVALRQMIGHGWNQISFQLPRWIYGHVHGELMEIDALKERRAKELALFQTP